MINQKLKPCPFCGGVADFRIRLINASRGISQMKAVCMVCEVETPHGFSDIRIDTKEWPAIRDAERWNNRTE